MKRTDSVLARAALAASLGLTAGAAHAVPLVFDFTGTVQRTSVLQGGQTTYDYSQAGQTVTGRITVETDGLQYFEELFDFGLSASYGDTAADPTEQVTSQLNIGGMTYDAGAYSADSGSVSAIDASAFDLDQVTVSDISTSYLGAPGQYFSSSLTLRWTDPLDPTGLIDLSNGFEPLDLAQWLADVLPRGNFNQNTLSCNDSYCLPSRISSTTFSVDSLTISTASVPEPGTLALFGIGLLGSGLVRRRKPS